MKNIGKKVGSVLLSIVPFVIPISFGGYNECVSPLEKIHMGKSEVIVSKKDLNFIRLREGHLNPYAKPPTRFSNFYDTNNDGVLDNRIDNFFVFMGKAGGFRQKEYSLENNPKAFEDAQKIYNQLKELRS